MSTNGSKLQFLAIRLQPIMQSDVDSQSLIIWSWTLHTGTGRDLLGCGSGNLGWCQGVSGGELFLGLKGRSSCHVICVWCERWFTAFYHGNGSWWMWWWRTWVLPFLVGQKKTIFQTTTITGVRIFCNLSTWDAESHSLTASYWIHWGGYLNNSCV